jgi:hypothetical protein
MRKSSIFASWNSNCSLSRILKYRAQTHANVISTGTVGAVSGGYYNWSILATTSYQTDTSAHITTVLSGSRLGFTSYVTDALVTYTTSTTYTGTGLGGTRLVYTSVNSLMSIIMR